MAVLAGQPRKLGLTNAPDAQNKQLVFVKLTDTSLEALTNFIKHANKNHRQNIHHNKPTIHFSHNSGTFSVPILGEDGSERQQKFTFSLSSIDEQNGPQGSFECLESRRPGSLESLGPIQDKVHVQASERDAYTRFGERMSNVKKDNENRSTRILENRNSSTANGLVTSSNKIVSRKHILANRPSGGGRSNDLHRYSHTHGYGSNKPSSSSSASSNSTLSHQPLNGCHPMLDRSKHKKPINSEIMKRSLRERIVHLLAVRPYKKPELLDRMNRDGLREKEKKELFPLVKTVSTMKDNTYHLHRHIWNDVSEDWPFYSEEERQAFRRRKPQNLTPPGSDGSTGSVASGHSSSSSHPASPQPSLKRPSAGSTSYLDTSPLSEHQLASSASGLGSNSPASKRKRVSNYVRQPNNLSPMMHSPTNYGLSSDRSAPENVMLSGESKTNAWLKTNQEQLENQTHHTTLHHQQQQNTHRTSTSTKHSSSQDYMTKFVRIENSEQRRIYKAEFNKDYNRYRVLYAQNERVSQRFASLQQKLRDTPESSCDYRRLKEMIVNEYQETNSNGQFKRDQEEFQYLHKKLAHIKKLVHDYDTKLSRSSREATRPNASAPSLTAHS